MIPQDKANHFIYGSVIGLIVALLTTPITAIVVVASIAFAKEMY